MFEPARKVRHISSRAGEQVKTSDMPNVERMRLKKECAERLEFFLRAAADRYFRSRKIHVEFRVEHDAEMKFLAVWRGEPAPEGWREYPAFGLKFNPYMSCWEVWKWGVNAEWWEEAELEYEFDSLDDAYDEARKRGLLFERPDWKGEGARA
jgi:hypothetical protein